MCDSSTSSSSGFVPDAAAATQAAASVTAAQAVPLAAAKAPLLDVMWGPHAQLHLPHGLPTYMPAGTVICGKQV
jgi:hypothetical protein